MEKRTIFLTIIFIVLVALAYGYYSGLLPFVLGTAYGLFLVNFIVYAAMFFASMMATFFIKKAFGPYISMAREKIVSAIKRR